MMRSNNVPKQAVNVPCQDQQGSYAERVALHHSVLVNYTKSKVHHWIEPRTGFLVGILPAQQPHHWEWSACALSSWWDSLKRDHSWDPWPSAADCIEGLGWWCLSHCTCCLNSNLNWQESWCPWTQETGSFSLYVARKLPSVNLWFVASWKSDQRIGMVPSGDKIHAFDLIHWVSIIFSGISHKKQNKCVSEAEKCSAWWRPGVNQHREIFLHFCENTEFCVIFFNIFNPLFWMLF